MSQKTQPHNPSMNAVSPNEEEKRPKNTTQEKQSPVESNGIPKSPASYAWSHRADEFRGPIDDSDTKELFNFGRVLLNRDFGADRARPLPFGDEGAYGGGRRSSRGAEPEVLSHGSHGNGGSTPQRLPVPPKGMTPKENPTLLANQPVKVTQQKRGCFRWF